MAMVVDNPEEVVVQATGSEPIEFELPLDELQIGESPRGTGVKHSHVQVLAHVEDRWPPILVTRVNHHIVDGVHRYHAAQMLGRTKIRCLFFDGDPEDAFIEAVRRNIDHGLPLKLREREQAAARVLTCRAGWSDRKIAVLCGLAPSTVRRLRECSTVQRTQLDKRQGRDGRIRPLDSGEVRRRTELVLRSRPNASLREVAKIVGTSPTTVRTVRAKLADADDDCEAGIVSLVPRPATALPRQAGTDTPNGAMQSQPAERNTTLVSAWSSDFAMRSTPGASAFCEWFNQTALGPGWHDHVEAVPLSRVYEIADEARKRAIDWKSFADAIENRIRNP